MKPDQKRATLRSMLALPLGVLGAAAVLRSPPAAARTTRPDELAALRTRLDDLEARAQITQVLHRYARGNDRVDEDALRSCFWPESTHQHGAFKGKSQDFVGFAFKVVSNLKNCSHIITNVSIDVAGGHAVSECYFLAHHRRGKAGGTGEEDYFLKGRYLDRFERRDGVWKIIHRRGVHDFSRLFDPADTSLDAKPAEQLSARKPDDPLYAMLAELAAGH
ncbi:MAG: nuclear transport factor 2 family protein [Steroidobacteraceae bacterium]